MRIGTTVKGILVPSSRGKAVPEEGIVVGFGSQIDTTRTPQGEVSTLILVRRGDANNEIIKVDRSAVTVIGNWQHDASRVASSVMGEAIEDVSCLSH